jgi:hypothetical protein
VRLGWRADERGWDQEQGAVLALWGVRGEVEGFDGGVEVRGLTLEMHDPQGTLLEELTMPGITQASVAITYAFCIAQISKTADWPTINLAIIARWKGKTALARIKEAAWKQVEEWQRRGAQEREQMPEVHA